MCNGGASLQRLFYSTFILLLFVGNVRRTGAGIVGLTKFLRSRKAVKNHAPSWSPAIPVPNISKQTKSWDQNGLKEGGVRVERRDKRGGEIGSEGNERSGRDKRGKDGRKRESESKNDDEVHVKEGRVETNAPAVARTDSSTARTENSPVRVDHVCIDMNQILHASFRSSSDPSHCMAKIFLELDSLLKVVEPTKSLVLTFDGPAPFAKLQTQRSRRITSPQNCLITPGTDFMNAMDDVMICYVLQRTRRPLFNSISVYISGARGPGEGELKIVDWLYTHVRSVKSASSAAANLDAILAASFSKNITETTGTSSIKISENDVVSGIESIEGSGETSTNGMSKSVETKNKKSAAIPDTQVKQSQLSGIVQCNDSIVICGSDSDILLQAMILSTQFPNIAVLQSGSDYADSFCNISSLVRELVAMTGLNMCGDSNTENTDISTLNLNGNTPSKNESGEEAKDINENGSENEVENEGESDVDESLLAEKLMVSDVVPVLTNIYDLPDSEVLPLNITASEGSLLHPDLVFLFIIQGNDYLPKIRGISMTRTLQIYGKTMLLLPNNKRFLIDNSTKSFNFLALYYFMRFLKEDGDGWVQLPEHYPTPVQTLHAVLQRTRIPENALPWVDSVYCIDPVTGDKIYSDESVVTVGTPENSNKIYWDAKLTLFNRTYTLDDNYVNLDDISDIPNLTKNNTSDRNMEKKTKQTRQLFNNKKSARNELAIMILKEIDLPAYEEMLANQESVKKNLQVYRDGVILEETDTEKPDGKKQNKNVKVNDSAANENSSDSQLQVEVEVEVGTVALDMVASDFWDEERGSVTESEYKKLVKDADVEDYLRGVLWVIQMYCEGVCPDYGYSFTGKPPPTASLIMKYIEKNMAPPPPSSTSSSSSVSAVSKTIKNGKIISKNGNGNEIEEIKIKNEDEIENERQSDKDKERAERVERSRLKVEEIELEMSTRAAAIHALRTAMNCKSDYNALNSYSKMINNNYNKNSNSNQTTQAENAKKFTNYLTSMRNKVAVSKLLCKPLSASATSVCVIPQGGEYFVPRHLRAIWKRMQKTFYNKFRQGTLTSTNYLDLSNHLKEVWKDAKIGTIDATSDNGMTETSSTVNRSGTTSNTTSMNSTAVKSSDILSQNVDNGPSPSFSFSSKPLDWVQQGIGLATRRNQRRGSRKERKEKGRVKAISKFSDKFRSDDDDALDLDYEEVELDSYSSDSVVGESVWDEEEEQGEGEDGEGEGDGVIYVSGMSSNEDDDDEDEDTIENDGLNTETNSQVEEGKEGQSSVPRQNEKTADRNNRVAKRGEGDKEESGDEKGALKTKKIGPIFIKDGDSEWTIITTADVMSDTSRFLPPHRRLPAGFLVLKSPQSVVTSIRKVVNKPVRKSPYSSVNSASDDGKKVYKKKTVKNAPTESVKNTVVENRNLAIKKSDKRREKSKKVKENKRIAIATENATEKEENEIAIVVEKSAEMNIPKIDTEKDKKNENTNPKRKSRQNLGSTTNRRTRRTAMRKDKSGDKLDFVPDIILNK